MAALDAPSAAARIVPRPDRAGTLPLGWRIAGLVAPLILLAAWGAWLFARQPAPTVGIGTQAPTFALTDLNGAPVRLADLAGRPVVLNFWASWCAPCVEEFPLLDAAARDHAGDGLAIVGVVYQDRVASAEAFMARMGATWPAAVDPGASVARAYGIYGPPETFFIGRDGIIAGHQIGQLTAADLDRNLTTILAAESP